MANILSLAVISAYAAVTGIVTAFGRVGFGIQQALDSRYTVFSLFFISLSLAKHSPSTAHAPEMGAEVDVACFLTNFAWLVAFAALSWMACYQKNVVLLRFDGEYRMKLITHWNGWM